MKVIKYPDEMKNLALTIKSTGKSIAIVPTMGALHDGHLSLLKIAKENADISVMTIFVNPRQFGEGEDLDTYPRTFEEDLKKAEENGCDIVFAPQESDMYPPGYATNVSIDRLTNKLCGNSRPGHFDGVATVVLKLFNIVLPNVAVFGQKDIQQTIIIRRMCIDLNLSVNIIVAPIIREDSGLAMSSRNVYLSEDEKKDVPSIYKGLLTAKKAFDEGVRNTVRLFTIIKQVYADAHMFSVEYLEIVDSETLENLHEITDHAIIAVACRTSETETRLIDNIIL